ncbi:MAG: DUF2892 domain-containing protein [Acidobacteriota bacterium]
MINRILRGTAGLLIILSIFLGFYVHKGFYFLTLFVGINLLQSAFTNWCPLMTILKKAGISE